MPRKVALITGGGSGVGLAVAKALLQNSSFDWTVHVVDLNEKAGSQATCGLQNTHFHRADVGDYSSLASTFEAVYNDAGRLDFVFANAGIVERDNFYAKHEMSGPPPPPPKQSSVDINYKAVVDTSYLALHYFRKGKATRETEVLDPVLIMTSSCGGLYPSEFCPIYSGSKAAVIHFNRAISVAYHHEGIRTFAVCPGMIRTGLLSQEEWQFFAPEHFTPVETVSNTVLKLVEGGEMEDVKGVTKSKHENWGLTVEVNTRNFYFRSGPEFCDDDMKSMMANTSMAKQLARIEGATSGT